MAMLVPGLVSVTFRNLPAAEVVRRAAQAGLSCMEWGADVHVPPGDLASAQAVRELTEGAGLAVACYGSYYRAGIENQDPFEAVIVTAKVLGAPRIRVWAGNQGAATASAADRARVADDLRRLGEAAANHSQTIVLEYHGNTLTDLAESALALLEDVGLPNVRLGWQPNVHTSPADRLADLGRVVDCVETVHAFHWTEDGAGIRRWPLAAGEADWRRYVEVLSSQPGSIPFMLEFMPGDSPDALSEEARTLIKWAQAGMVQR